MSKKNYRISYRLPDDIQNFRTAFFKDLRIMRGRYASDSKIIRAVWLVIMHNKKLRYDILRRLQKELF